MMRSIKRKIRSRRLLRLATASALVVVALVSTAIATTALESVVLGSESDNRVTAKQRSLNMEAAAIYEGLSHLSTQDDHSHSELESYLDTVCNRLTESKEADSHVLIQNPLSTFRVASCACVSPDLACAINRASEASQSVQVGKDRVVAGSFESGGTRIIVSELMVDIDDSLFGDSSVHFMMLSVAMVCTLGLAYSLHRFSASRPSRNFARTASQSAGASVEHFDGKAMNSELTLVPQSHSQTSKHTADERSRVDQIGRARQVQERILPTHKQIPGLVLAGAFQPAEDLAGDYYDVISYSDGTWLLCMADVAGHGIPAAMCMLMLKPLVMQAVELGLDPSELLGFVNQRVPNLLGDEFVTMFVGRWDPATYHLKYASAGHEPAVLLNSSADICVLNATGLPLGVDIDSEWDDQFINVSAGDKLLLTTDGVSEAMDSNGQEFGRLRLHSLFESLRTRPAHEIVSSLESAVREHSAGKASDDVTILVCDAIESRSELC